tara:strand:+ start:7491 stop:8021 length:531 start_codon:yes stop_codon:yes gene_type:complete
MEAPESDQERRARLRAKLRNKINNKRTQTGRSSRPPNAKDDTTPSNNDRYGFRKALGAKVDGFLEDLNESIDNIMGEYPASEREEASKKVTKKMIKLLKSGKDPFGHVDKTMQSFYNFIGSMGIHTEGADGYDSTPSLASVEVDDNLVSNAAVDDEAPPASAPMLGSDSDSETDMV